VNVRNTKVKKKMMMMLMFVSVRKIKNMIRITSMKADFSRENIDQMMIVTSIEKIDLNAEEKEETEMIEKLKLIVLFNIKLFYCIYHNTNLYIISPINANFYKYIHIFFVKILKMLKI
jgi:hypothetical protein